MGCIPYTAFQVMLCNYLEKRNLHDICMLKIFSKIFANFKEFRV